MVIEYWPDDSVRSAVGRQSRKFRYMCVMRACDVSFITHQSAASHIEVSQSKRKSTLDAPFTTIYKRCSMGLRMLHFLRVAMVAASICRWKGNANSLWFTMLYASLQWTQELQVKLFTSIQSRRKPKLCENVVNGFFGEEFRCFQVAESHCV